MNRAASCDVSYSYDVSPARIVVSHAPDLPAFTWQIHLLSGVSAWPRFRSALIEALANMSDAALGYTAALHVRRSSAAMLA